VVKVVMGYFGDQGPTLSTVYLLESKPSPAYVCNQVKVGGDSPGILTDRLRHPVLISIE